jgi:dipeptidyl aminopeptidase/acylaminoacyl peptidase
MSRQVSSYGSWKSPITSDMVASNVIGLGQVEIEGENIYWCETRPSEAGRYVVVKHFPDGRTIDMNPSPFNVRTRVHEYGGGAYKIHGDMLFFVNFADQRVYTMKLGEKPEPITSAADLRYADFEFDDLRSRVICIREDHRERGKEAVNTIVGMDLEGNDVRVLACGNNFYSSPRISPDGKFLAWLTWSHPCMPWDRTELWMCRLGRDGLPEERMKVAGELEESVTQPSWSLDGTLYFVSDRSNWWNIYCWKDGEVRHVCPLEAEFATPQWVFALSNYDFESEHSVICSYAQKGRWHIARLDTETGRLEEIATPYTQVSSLRTVGNCLVFIGGSSDNAASIVKLDLKTCELEVLKRSSEVHVDAGYLSKPKQIEFPTENGLTAYAIFYRPRNKDYVAMSGTLPPLLVFIHGGPTAAASTTLSLGIQFWTSRGFAVVDVNYGGSTGYGREFRKRLYGQWGVVDMDDCVNAAKYLIDAGEVDGEKLAIRGGSAGGYTTINALTFRDIFKAGASYYGISDLEVFVKDTHKFESRYLDSLVGPYPERRDLYRERSAINFLDRLKAPMILFQGLEDKVVPPNQAELIVEALKKKGRPVAYLAFEGEQHGFRMAKNIKRSLEAELYFYSRIFGFKLADRIKPIKIHTL